MEQGTQLYANKKYPELIKPIEKELVQAKTETILYAPDGQLRYVPLAALYDGKQWLIEKYRISNLISYSLSDFVAKQKVLPSILAGAFGGKGGERKFGHRLCQVRLKKWLRSPILSKTQLHFKRSS
ncbi:MAG: CHAT domain-containing protein, partial [Pseudanabaena sp.]